MGATQSNSQKPRDDVAVDFYRDCHHRITTYMEMYKGYQRRLDRSIICSPRDMYKLFIVDKKKPENEDELLVFEDMRQIDKLARSGYVSNSCIPYFVVVGQCCECGFSLEGYNVVDPSWPSLQHIYAHMVHRGPSYATFKHAMFENCAVLLDEMDTFSKRDAVPFESIALCAQLNVGGLSEDDYTLSAGYKYNRGATR